MAMHSEKTGVLLVNLGTPDAPQAPEVRAYLRQFLMDPYVIDIPFIFRWLLVHGAILPRRPAESARAYRKVWTEKGSPLKFNTEELAGKVARALGGRFAVEYGMRYGRPSLGESLEKLRDSGVKKVIALPLYPQYSLAATESSVAEIRRLAREMNMQISTIGAFYGNPGFIEEFAKIAKISIEDFKPDFVLFSFHGLPEKQVRKTDRSGSRCLSDRSCCEAIVDANRDCYRAQCYATAHAIARKLDLPRDQYEIAFQSRLGSKWIQPFTDHLYEELPKRGVKRLAVISPSFVADCLETLEEIAIRGREQFVAAGGEDLHLVPSLNARDGWAQAVSRIVSEACA